MYLINKLLTLVIFFVLSSQANGHICFTSIDFQEQKVCYTTDAEKDLVTKKYFLEFTKKISNPGNIVRLEGEMAKLYTPEQFRKSLVKYYSHVTPKSIEQIISQGDLSAIFLKTGEIMYFNHTYLAFIFDFDSPLIFVGAHKLFGKGSKPIKQEISNKKSSCNLHKEGVVFLSPNKESRFYKKNSTYCNYAGHFFDNIDNNITVRLISSIGKDHYSISGLTIEFANFLKWLLRP